MKSLENNFWRFHRQHPEVYAALVKLCREWRIKVGATRIGIATVYEAARYTLNITRGDDTYKLANNHKSFYARLIMQNETDLADIFILKQLRYPCSFGPENVTLPPNAGNNPFNEDEEVTK